MSLEATSIRRVIWNKLTELSELAIEAEGIENIENESDLNLFFLDPVNELKEFLADHEYKAWQREDSLEKELWSKQGARALSWMKRGGPVRRERRGTVRMNQVGELVPRATTDYMFPCYAPDVSETYQSPEGSTDRLQDLLDAEDYWQAAAEFPGSYK